MGYLWVPFFCKAFYSVTVVHTRKLSPKAITPFIAPAQTTSFIALAKKFGSETVTTKTPPYLESWEFPNGDISSTTTYPTNLNYRPNLNTIRYIYANQFLNFQGQGFLIRTVGWCHDTFVSLDHLWQKNARNIWTSNFITRNDLLYISIACICIDSNVLYPSRH